MVNNNENNTNAATMTSAITAKISIKIGIIGGSGLDQDDSILLNKQLVPVPETPFGLPSDPEVVHGTIDGVEVYILGRHGRKHNINPTNVNYRANLWTLHQLGVTHILATTAVGSLKESIEPGDLAILDQYIDRTCIRGGRSFYTVAHIPQGKPFETRLQQVLFDSAREAGYTIHPATTAVAIEGPRFSTLAESRLYQAWGADLVNMTLVPEVQLASELGLIYASLALVTDYDCWHVDDQLTVSVDCVMKRLATLSVKAKNVLVRSVTKIKSIDWTNVLEERQSVAKMAVMVE